MICKYKRQCLFLINNMKGISTIRNGFLSDFKYIDFCKVIRYMRNKDNKWRLFRSWSTSRPRIIASFMIKNKCIFELKNVKT